ncbi:MAG: Ser-Thr-rich GPI-anchored membrane family protein [Candidatus Thorarchaeota archaeon]
MRISNSRKCTIAIVLFIFLTGCSIFPLMNITSILSNKTNEPNYSDKKLRSSSSSPLFDGMYILHNLTDVGIDIYSSNITYTYNSGSFFDVLWTLTFGTDAWQVDSNNREISGSTSMYFSDFSHSPFWIFPNASLGDNILISSIWFGDRTFEVINDLTYELSGYGLVDVWILQDLADPTAVAWYEKSTGILLNGTFYYSGGNNYLIFDFIDTNVAFTYAVYDSQLFDGMQINHIFSIYGVNFSSTFSYVPDSGYSYNETWDVVDFIHFTWQVNTKTRIMSGGSAFGDGAHTPAWIFTNVSLGDTVLIAVDGEGDHSFLVAGESTYDLPSFGTLDIWLLEDLDFTGGWAWYEKSTGILLNGLFFFSSGLYNYTFDFVHSNAIPGFFDDFENNLYKWQTLTGLWHLTNDSSAWPDPYHSPTHSMWFGNESTGDYETGFREMGDLVSKPFSLYKVDKAFLEFYHWRDGELNYDFSYVYLSIDGISWDLIYSTDKQITPWEKVSLDISQYAGNRSVQVRFFFDTHDNFFNNFRGWLVDDIEVVTYDLSHDLSVSLEAPLNPHRYNNYQINATIFNTGKNTETDVELLLFLNDMLIGSMIVPNLPVGASETLEYMWNPTQYGLYNFTVYTAPLPEEEYTENNLESQILSVSSTLNGPVAIFRNVLPWGMNVTEPILKMYNIDYTIFNSSDMGTVSLTSYEKVIIESDQDQLFYNMLGSYVSWFESYASNGGILEIHACDDGWNGGSWYGLYLIPGGLNQTKTYTDSIAINIPQHPILFSPHTIIDADLDEWGWSAHGSFNYYPGISEIVLIDSGTSNPVFIELDFGEGTILASMQTLEYGYGSAYSLFLENVILYNPDSIVINTPNSVSSWETGTSQSITWTSIGSISDVKIELYKDGIFEFVIVPSTINDGEYTWAIPPGLDDSAQYQIKIVDVSKPSTTAMSDYFELYNPFINVINPTSSNSWKTSTSQSITWTSQGTIVNVKIELYDNGVFVMEIASTTPNDGEFTWSIPTELVTSDQYQIKITDISDLNTYDFSDYFEIVKQTSTTGGVPSYNIYIIIGIISIVSTILLRKKIKTKTNI